MIFKNFLVKNKEYENIFRSEIKATEFSHNQVRFFVLPVRNNAVKEKIKKTTSGTVNALWMAIQLQKNLNFYSFPSF